MSRKHHKSNPKKDKAARRLRPAEIKPIEVGYRKRETVGPATTFDLTEAIKIREGVEVAARVTVVAVEGTKPEEISRIAGEFLAGGAAKILGRDIHSVRPAKPRSDEIAVVGPVTLGRDDVLLLFAQGGLRKIRVAPGGEAIYKVGEVRFLREEFIEAAAVTPALATDLGVTIAEGQTIVFAADCPNPSAAGAFRPAQALTLENCRAAIQVMEVEDLGPMMYDGAPHPKERAFAYTFQILRWKTKPPADLMADAVTRRLAADAPQEDPVPAKPEAKPALALVRDDPAPATSGYIQPVGGPFHYVLKVDGEPIGEAGSMAEIVPMAYDTMHEILTDQIGVARTPDDERKFVKAREALETIKADHQGTTTDLAFALLAAVMKDALGWDYSIVEVPGIIALDEKHDDAREVPGAVCACGKGQDTDGDGNCPACAHQQPEAPKKKYKSGAQKRKEKAARDAAKAVQEAGDGQS